MPFRPAVISLAVRPVFRLVLGTGIEPARDCSHSALNAARLPIPPPELVFLSTPKGLALATPKMALAREGLWRINGSETDGGVGWEQGGHEVRSF